MKLPALRYWRTALPAAALAAVVVLLARHTYPLPADAGLLLWYTRLDPLLLLSHLRWEGAFPAWGWLPLTTVILTLAAGRVFCGWLCPLGGLLAILHSVKAKLWRRGRQGPPAWTGRLYSWRYPWLLFLLVLLTLGSGWAMFLSPFHLLTTELTRLWQHQVPWLLITLLAVGLIIFPRFWCVFLCPTGLLLSLLARWRRLTVRPPAECVHCGLCERTCPSGAARPEPEPAGRDCLVCGRCSEICPVARFTLAARHGDYPAGEGGSFTRREILRAGVALAVAGAAMPAVLTRPAGANPLRPPGALEEDEFLARCSRCGRCLKACPAQCIKAAPLTSGPAMFLTPVIIPREARCELTGDCQKVCPTGALSQLPVEKTLIGLAEIDRSRCIGWAEGRLCLLCQEQCPQHAIDSDDRDRPSVVTDLCVGCGACENGCPLDEAAIVVRPQNKRRRP
jgi:polyferredoxin